MQHFGTSVRDVVGCRVCGRTLLMGERSTGFFTADGAGPYDVCDLCISRARSYGLRVHPADPDEVAAARRRRAWKVRIPRPKMRRTPAAPTALPVGAIGTGAIPAALASFNESSHARTLAGLHRTLGDPRASVVPRSATDREVILTVAWEIVWYQFRVMPDGIEQLRGTYLSELQPRWQQWNCTVTPEGTVREAGALSARAGHDPADPSVEETTR